MNKCIGIISYLPSKWSARNNRITKLRTLLDKCNRLFNNIPVIIIAQNYNDEDATKILLDNITIVRFDKPLGITLARETLRRYFLDNTNYDVIILLDDDCEIVGESAKEYLRQLETHPYQLGAFHDALHKLMSVPRNVYGLYGYDLKNTPEQHIAFEDSLFYWPIVALDNPLHFRYKDTGLKEVSKSRGDKDSCWCASLDKQTRMIMSVNTNKLLEERTGMKVLDIYKLEGYQRYNVTEVDD